jgi:hypothetical protein
MEIRDTAIEAIAEYLVAFLNNKGDGLTVVESVGFTNTYFNKLFGGFPLLNIWRSRRFHQNGYFSGTTITIHYLLASAADYQQIPGMLNFVSQWIYEAMRDYSYQCELIKFDAESYGSEARAIAYSGTKGVTELPLLEITFDIQDLHSS